MSNVLPLAVLLLALAGCQSATAPTTASPLDPPAAATPSAISMPAGTPAPTVEAARAAVSIEAAHATTETSHPITTTEAATKGARGISTKPTSVCREPARNT